LKKRAVGYVVKLKDTSETVGKSLLKLNKNQEIFFSSFLQPVALKVNCADTQTKDLVQSVTVIRSG